jgi:hypothetical protein
MPNPNPNRQFGPRRDIRRLFRQPMVKYELPLLDVPDPRDYRESPEFARYCALISSVLSPTEPLTIRAIHERLGRHIRREWTIDALDRVAHRRIAYIDTYIRKTL